MRGRKIASKPTPHDAVDDVYAEAARILVLGEAYCAGLPWDALDMDEKVEWHSRGLRYRRTMEERGMIVTAEDDLQ